MVLQVACTQSTPECIAHNNGALHVPRCDPPTLHNFPSFQQLVLVTTWCCQSPASLADGVPTSLCVETAFCKLATNQLRSSLRGHLLGSISASYIPPPPPQWGPHVVPGKATLSACASFSSNHVIGAFLQLALSLLQLVPVHLPWVEAMRCLASSWV